MNNSNITHLFSIPTFQGHISTEELLLLQNEIFSFINNNPSQFTSEHWMNPTKSTFSREYKEYPFWESVKNIVLPYIKQYYEYYQFEPHKVSLEQVWINISEKGDYQELHSHTTPSNSNLFSGIIYLKTPKNSGNLILHHPNKLITDIMPSSPKVPKISQYIPQEGSIILFPSWLEHEVWINKSDESRISISFNLKYAQ